MYGEIIAIGNELISGRVLNTTSTFTASKLFAAGYQVNRITTVGDVPEEIEECLLNSIRRSKFVIVTGGLGPTTDDITNEVVARVLGRRLIVYQEILDKLESTESRWGLTPTAMKEKLAWLPEGAEILNPRGHAAGYYLMHNNIPVFFLPGVPSQLEDHMVKQVLPRLNETISARFTSRQRTFKVFGLLETEINTLLEKLESKAEGVCIGYYPNFPEVSVTITAKDIDPRKVREDFRRICEEVEIILADNVVAIDEETLETAVGKLLLKKGGILALAESCTGGLLGHRITSVAGSSAWFERGVVCYSNRSKEETLEISPETLSRYGAVSEETARAMANAIKEMARVNYGLAVTGIAGPTGGTASRPVGTVFIAMATPERTVCERFVFPGTRNMVQALAAETALDWLRRHLSDGTYIPGYRPAD
jgi:nicotinamide-nucleotide amidase